MLEAIFCAFRQHFLKRERKNPLQLKWICTNKTVPTHKAGNKHTISVLRTSLSAVRAWRQVFTPLEYRCVVHVTYNSSALWMLAISSSPYWLLEKPLKFFSSIKIHLFFLFFFLFFSFFSFSIQRGFSNEANCKHNMVKWGIDRVVTVRQDLAFLARGSVCTTHYNCWPRNSLLYIRLQTQPKFIFIISSAFGKRQWRGVSAAFLPSPSLPSHTK